MQPSGKINGKKTLNVYLLFWCSILITLSSVDEDCCCWSGEGGISVGGTWCHNEAAMPGTSGNEALLVLGTRECCRNKDPDDADC